MAVTIRKASPSDAIQLAALRWEWVHNAAPDEFDPQWQAFAAHMASWMISHAETHFAFIAQDDGAPIGMAWLALLARVPDPQRFNRFGADLQSVYVKPAWRAQRIGNRLVSAVMEAGSQTANHLTVRTGQSATSYYPQLGFANNPTSLERQLKP